MDSTPQAHLHQFLHVLERPIDSQIEFLTSYPREGLEPRPGEPLGNVLDWR